MSTQTCGAAGAPMHRFRRATGSGPREDRDHRRRRHRRLSGGQARAGGRRGHLPRARRQPAGHRSARLQADRRRRQRAGRAQRARQQRLPRCRRARRGGAGDEGAPARRGGRRRAAAVRPRDGDRADAKRHPVLVLPQARRPVRGPHAAKRRSRGPHRPRDSARPRARLRGLPGQRAGRAGRGATHRGRPFPARRARWLDQRARAARQRCLRARRLQGAAAGRHPLGDLAQAVGQPGVQPGERVDARHARGHLPLRADARTGRLS